ncbi:peptidase [Sphingomonas morindae]|uniref:Peptidase n=1 Tax=Sphingomonas morindae TaxID=1541170 RepID=A0ABY4X563_9SPHN|nr:peptidase [Sphingomonas morindae]USI72036.1 peptidase [Sphingomonas morindae]
MTYCVGMLVEAGLVMIADTRTNAGVDDISVYRKLHILADAPDRLVVAASAGNLSITQSVLASLAEGLAPHEGESAPRTVATMPSMFRVAQLVGEAVHACRADIARQLETAQLSPSCAMLVGGRVGPGPLALYRIYAEGNFIACMREQPFLQIGETKYGKPILDRALHYDTPLEEVVKVGLISFDSTLRSNLAVGRPLDLISIPAERARPVVSRRIESDDAYFNDLSTRWSLMLNEARATIPDPPFMSAPPSALR